MGKPYSTGISPTQAHEAMEMGAVMLDLRSEQERVLGMPEDAIAVLPEDVGEWLQKNRDVEPVILLCARGVRSAAAAETQAPDRQLISVQGGYRAWQKQELPITGHPFEHASRTERYQKHLLLDEIGIAGQKKLLEARVLIVGAGGLGSPAALYLTAAGVGEIGLLDDDRVERSNLQRQILHTDAGVGSLKTDSARDRLVALNPDTTVTRIAARLSTENAEALISGWDMVVDAVDNFPSRYALMDAAAALSIPVIYGAVDRFSGQLGVFMPWEDPDQACYRCLFPNAPESALNCSEAGVLGAVPGVIGTLQAVEAIKLICGIGQPLISNLMIYDASAASTRKVRVARDPACKGVGHG